VSANDKQISGNHYRKQKIQSWDFVAANKLDFFQGSAVTYIARFRDKGGRRDLEKAVHFIEKLIELEYGEENPLADKIIPCNNPQNMTEGEIKQFWTRSEDERSSKK